MKLDLKVVKEWLKIDGDEEDQLIHGLMRAAEAYLYNATGRKRFGKDTDLAETLCFYLITHWYEDRDFYSPSPQAAKKPIITSIMTQLQLGGDDCEDTPESGGQSRALKQKSGTARTKIRRQ